MSEMEKYSHPTSKKFWDRIQAISNPTARALVYLAGCALQDHETRVFRMLEQAEDHD